MESLPGLRIVFLGTPECAATALRAVAQAGHEVLLAITPPDRPRGRGGRSAPSPLKRAAEALGIPVHQPENVNAEECVERIRDTRLDVLLVVAYGRILKRPLLEVSRLLPINLHFSLLPEFRGAAPVAWAIARGRTETGVTTQRIVRKLDAGPVLAAERVTIGSQETAGELMDRLADVGAALTVRTLEAVARGEHVETPQDPSRATRAPMLAKSDGEVDWGRSARDLHCHIRAMDPWPGATTVFTGAARPRSVGITLLRSRMGAEEATGLAVGEVVSAGGEGIVVQTGRGLLTLESMKPAGKRALTAREFTNGYRAAPGDRFGHFGP